MAALLVVVIALGVVAAVFVAPYLADGYRAPIGYDVPKYLWRTNLVAARGTGALAGSAPAPFSVNADRPGLPVVWSLASSWLRAPVMRVAIVHPALMAVLVGLAAAALAGTALAEPRWAAALFAVLTGASINVARMAGPGYDDNLLVSPLLMGAAVLALAAASAPRGPRTRAGPATAPGAGAVALLVAATLVHWNFVLLFALVLAAVALLLLPASLRAGHDGGFWSTPSGRLGGILGAAVVLGPAALKGLAAGEPRTPRLPREGFLLKLGRDVPRYRFAIGGPWSAIGAAALLRAPDPVRRRGLLLALVWAVTGGAAVALLLAGLSLPAHRFLAFGLGFPLLMAVAASWVTRALLRSVSRRARTLRWAAVGAAVTLGAAAAIGGAWLAHLGLTGAHPWIADRQFAQARVAGDYLARVGGDRPVVFVVDMGGVSPASASSLAFHVIRSGLPGAVVPRTSLYLGDAEELLAGRPTIRGEPAFDEASRLHFAATRALLAHDPIVLLMPAFDRGFGAAMKAHPGWRLAPDLAVARGPRVGVVPGPTPGLPLAPSAGALVVLLVAAVGMLAALGGGWAVVLLPATWFERSLLAAPLGLAVVVLGGVVAGRLGAAGGAAGGSAAVIALGAAGWLAATGPFRRRFGLT